MSSEENPDEGLGENAESLPDSNDLLTEIPHEASYRVATLQERFAAFVTDGLIFVYLLAAWAYVLKYFTRGEIGGSLSFRSSELFLFVTTGVAIHFLYFLFFEGVLTATPGKLLGGLSVQKKSGEMPSLIAILVRNVFRIVDYPLFFFTAVGLMEKTEKHQRLGDLLSGTVVMKAHPFLGRRIDPETAIYAGATRRSLALVIDLLFWTVLLYGALFAIPVSMGLAAMIALNLLPLLILLTMTLSETLFQTTLGKALFGVKITREDGRPGRFSVLLVRNLFRLVDTSPLGYLAVILSSRKQRIGDVAAGTLALRAPQGLRGWLAVPFMLFLTATALFSGSRNQDNFLKQGLHLRIGPWAFNPVPIEIQRLKFRTVHIESLEFGFNEHQANEKALFDTGDVVYLLLDVSGFSIRNNREWVQVDLKVADTNKNVVLDQANILNSSLEAHPGQPVRLITRFALNPQATPGLYQVTLVVRDLFGSSTVTETRNFTVRQ